MVYRPTYRRRRAAPRAGPKRYTRRRPVYRRASRNVFRGRGAYTAPRSAGWGNAIGTGVGSLLGLNPVTKAFAAPASELLGRAGSWLGNKVGTYMGWGDYTVRYNTLANAKVSEGLPIPSMHRSGKTMRVSHIEFLGKVTSSATAGEFKLESYQINPGNQQAFPWFATMALMYQKYRIHGMIIVFKSNYGSAFSSTNAEEGVVIMSTNYNCADPNFRNRSEMENTQYTNQAKPSEPCRFAVECDPYMQSQTSLYLAAGGVPQTGVGINECNWCNFQIATEGVQAEEVNLGSLYISFDIELMQPVNKVDGSVFRGDWFSLSGSGPTWVANGFPNAVANAANGLRGSVTSGDTYRFPNYIQSGLFRVTYYIIIATEETANTVPSFEFTNCTLVSIMPPGVAPPDLVNTVGFGGDTGFLLTFTVRVNRSGAFFHVTSGAVTAAGGSGGLMVDQIDADYDVS